MFYIYYLCLSGDQKSNGYHTSVPNNSFFNKSSGEDIWKAMSGKKVLFNYKNIDRSIITFQLSHDRNLMLQAIKTY